MEAVETHPETELLGVILAAGKGMRAYPATRYVPKVLLDIAGNQLRFRVEIPLGVERFAPLEVLLTMVVTATLLAGFIAHVRNRHGLALVQ